MNTIIGELGKSQKFIDLSKQIEKEKSPISISGLTSVGMTEIISAINGYNKKSILLITYNEIQAKKILQNSWEVRLKVWKRFFNVYFDYDIETFKDHTNTDDEASKIATNLRNVRVWENWKKTNINFYDEIKDIILKEILNNTHFNTNLL